MRDIAVVFRKELKELTGDRSSFRGTLIQGSVVILLCGVLLPLRDPQVLASVEACIMLFVVFPVTLAAAVAADSFAGEQERGTLETLLASPLTESDIFIGKASIAAAVAVAVSTLTTLSAFVVMLGSAHSQPFAAASALAAILFGAVGGGLLLAALVAMVSLKVKAARSAQQIGSILSLGLAFAASYEIHHFWPELTWHLVEIGDLVLLVFAGIALLTGLYVFKRGRLLTPQ